MLLLCCVCFQHRRRRSRASTDPYTLDTSASASQADEVVDVFPSGQQDMPSMPELGSSSQVTPSSTSDALVDVEGSSARISRSVSSRRASCQLLMHVPQPTTRVLRCENRRMSWEGSMSTFPTMEKTTVRQSPSVRPSVRSFDLISENDILIAQSNNTHTHIRRMTTSTFDHLPG